MSQHFGDLEGVKTDIDDIIVHAETKVKHGQPVLVPMRMCILVKNTALLCFAVDALSKCCIFGIRVHDLCLVYFPSFCSVKGKW